MIKIEAGFRARLQQRPDDTVRLIVRVSGEMQQAIARLEELNFTVHRSFKIIPAISVSCKGTTALALLEEPWVEAVEEDRQVFHQAQDTTSANS